MSDHIPFELQVEIIKNLPVKSLIRFRSVSKTWKSVIDSSDFIAGYTVRSHDRPHYLLIRYDNLSCGKKYVSFVDDDSFPKNKFSPTVPPSVNLLRDSFFVGASHGLVCVFGYYSETPMAVIWNPSIRKSAAIEVPDLYRNPPGRTVFGFGVCSATGDHKIVKINDGLKHMKMKSVTSSSHWQVEVYSLSSGVWRKSFGNLPGNFVKFRRPHSQVTTDGFIYWLCRQSMNNNLIMSFDLSSEEFREIYLPEELAQYYTSMLYLYKRINSLVVLKESIMDGFHEVWMMENGDLESFTNLFTINGSYFVSRPLEFRRNGELMMRLKEDTEDSDALVVYQPLSDVITDLGIKGVRHSLRVSSYTESLILLDQPDTLAD